jgi:hypothetical protein
VEELLPVLTAWLEDGPQLTTTLEAALAGEVAFLPLEAPPFEQATHILEVHVVGANDPFLLLADPVGFATNGRSDELALEMLGHLLNDLPIQLEVTKGRMLASEAVSLAQAQDVSVICLADLPPSPPSKTRYLVKRLHASLPNVRIVVGRWGPPALMDESLPLLREAGATLVASTLAETRTYLGGLVETHGIPVTGASGVEAA